MRRLLILTTILAFSLSALADGENAGRRIRRDHSCLEGYALDVTRSGVRRVNIIPANGWEAGRTYRIPVLLMEFSDRSFSMEKPKETYDSLFNMPGYNLGHGPGCVADYFREQSGGLFSPQYEIIGPVKVSTSYKLNTDYNSGSSQISKALALAGSELDNKEYDWDNDGYIESVIVVYAGYGGNESSKMADGCIWPSTSSVASVKVGDLRASTFSASAEQWTTGSLCGIGTICHEYSHCLALPDFYPVTNSIDADYSVLDEWDLMDGGNFCDGGWCPPNYSAHEKEFVGWATPVDLTESTHVTGMKSVSDGGTCYRIRADLNSSANEYLLLENRQWQGWDYFLPGHGLLVTHVDFSKSVWSSFAVNSDKKHYRLHYVNADSHSFPFDELLYPKTQMYDSLGRNKRLSGTAYPYVSDTLVNRELTDTSTPASTLFNVNTSGEKLLSKPIVNIEENDGLISFSFYDDNTVLGIGNWPRNPAREADVTLYDLMGRRVESPRQGGIYIRQGKKIIIQ